MRDLSKTLSILIPMYNEEGTIENTLNELVRKGFHERYEIVVCDDDSTDKSVEQAQVIAETFNGISLVMNKPNGNKIGAIITGLMRIKTPYVLLLDADSMIVELTKGYLDKLVQQMQDQDITAIGFKIRVHATNMLESFQSLELMLSTDGLRQLLKIVVCLAGPANLWNVDRLKTVAAQHSGRFEGDDLETTILATLYNFNVVSETRQLIATTKPKRNLAELFRQRMNIWDIGLIRAFVSTRGFLKHKGPNGAFFNGVFITDVLAHPFRILSIIGILLTSFLFIMGSLDNAFNSRLLAQVNYSTLSILQSTSWIYLLLWLLNIISIVRALQHSPNSVLNGLRFILYFTFYMATPLIPLIFDDFGQAMGLTYLWWYSLCAVLVLLSAETWSIKVYSLLLSFLMPFYFAFLFVLPRTLGFAKYFLRKIQGKYPDQSNFIHR